MSIVSEGLGESFPVDVELPRGVARVSADRADVPDPRATAIIAHGAGAGYRHPFLVGLARALNDEGFSTVRFAFPYAEAGRRMPGPASHAIATWRAVVDAVRAAGPADRPIVACGKSYGGRMASMAEAAGEIDVDALVYLGYPLHPPGDAAKLRTAHLPDVRAPQLFLTGRTDPFSIPHDQLERAVESCRDARLEWVEGNHSFEVAGQKRSAEEIGAGVATPVAQWLTSAVAR